MKIRVKSVSLQLNQQFKQVLSEAALAEGLLQPSQVPLRSTLARTVAFLGKTKVVPCGLGFGILETTKDFTGEFTIFNATGLKVLNTPLSFTDSESQYIDLGALPTGLYTYAIYQDGKLVQSANISLIK